MAAEYGIAYLSITPLRTEPKESSELCSQIFAGELLHIKEVQEKWLLVELVNDLYLGWVDRKMIYTISKEEYENERNAPKITISSLIAVANFTDGSKTLLPMGSKLKHDGKRISIYNKEISNIDGEFIQKFDLSTDLLLKYASDFINTPYLWGGKSVMGIDCSGLVQTAYATCNIILPRDASQQVKCGELVAFIHESKTGDLAFFDNKEGKITHVGILINSSSILHSSGHVRVDMIDSEGIYNIELAKYTHKLRIIRRIII